MSRGRATRRLLCLPLLGVAYALGLLFFGQTAGLSDAQAGTLRTGSSANSSAVTLQVSAGYQNIYRGTAWTPVRVILRNGSNADISGRLEIPQSSQASSVGATPLFHGLYETPVVLPAGGSKLITVYVPGSGVQERVDANFYRGTQLLASSSAYPMGIDSSALLIGVLDSGPAESAWIGPAIEQQVTTHVIRLSPRTLDPVPGALATFDLIVLTNVDTSQLDRAQINALQSYVQSGGSLLVVGGPTWQETLRPLAGSLLPGVIVGTRVVPDLHGLSSLGARPRESGHASSVVSVLSHATGTVLASQAGVPLVVRKASGQGTVEYVAFDPSLQAARGWSSDSRLLQHLITTAAPTAIGRTWSPQGFRARFQNVFKAVALTQELSNLPAATLPLLTLFAALTLAYVLILGPANFLILRWIGRQHLAWFTIPALAVVYLGSAYALANHLRSGDALVNSVGMVTLDGTSRPHPATFYVGMAAPLPGDYHLTYSSSGLPAPLPQVKQADGFFFRNASTLQSTPLGMRLQESPQTGISLLSMQRWAMRDLTLDTSVNIPGSIWSNLTIDSRGNISGTIHNGTNLDLVEPVVVAGEMVTHVSTIPAHSTVAVSVSSGGVNSDDNSSSLWASLYGGPDLSSPDGFGGFRDCCGDFSFPSESRLIDRVRNAVAMLSQVKSLSPLGNVLLLGWSQQPLGAFTVDGSTPRQRDLNLVVSPLQVTFPAHGSFTLRSGTFGAHLVDMVPQAPQSSCCGFGPRSDQQEVAVGEGGGLTFEFDLPQNRPVRFRTLSLGVSSDSVTNDSRVYDWRTLRWVNFDLSNGPVQLPQPNRFVSPKGQIMVELVATFGSGDLTVSDPYHALDLSGSGVVG